MRVGRSYKQEQIRGAYDAIVIGSGIGGLSAAALLAREGGKRVLVLERHYTAGGFTQAFCRRGYEWDVGVHYVGKTAPGRPERRLFDRLTDGALKWEDMGEVYDRIVVGGAAFDFVKGADAFRARMKEYFPAQARAIDEYVGLVRTVARSSSRYFMEKVVPAPIAVLGGAVMRAGALRWAKKTTLEVLRELTDDERLIGVLAGQYGNYGLPPSQSSFLVHALVVSHYLDGGAYPVGGAGRIAETIVPGIEAAGGGVFTSAEVAEIVVRGGRAVGVRLSDGNELRAPVVISDAGVRATFTRLLPEPERSRLSPLLEKLPPSAAHAALYVGLRRTAAELELPKANLWVYPSFDHDRSFVSALTYPEAPLAVAYISFPSARDPEFASRCPGRATIEVVTLAPYGWFRAWEGTRWHRRGAEYEDLKGRLEERLLDALYEQLPSLKGQVDYHELSTPLSTRHFTGHLEGEIYGLAHTPRRFAQRWLRPRTPVPGLFLTGADVATCGVTGAMMGGAMSASAILRRNVLGEPTRRTHRVEREPRAPVAA